MNVVPPRLQTLDEIEARLWRELILAAQDRQHEWRTPVLASADADGADARTVVLREVNPQTRTLVIYTDSRAAKVGQLQVQPRCTLVMWSQRLGWQLRLRARVQTHTDGLAVTSRWAALRLLPSARDYLSPLAPGAPLDAAPGEQLPSAPAMAAAAQREYFAVLVATVEAIDWVELHADGHRRASFNAGQAQWLVP